MRVKEPFETTGSFWVADHPEDKLPGVMKILETGRVSVELVGNFGGIRGAFHGLGISSASKAADSEYMTPKRICGKVLNGELVTLEECEYWVPKLRIGGVSGGSSTSVVRPMHTLVGAEYGRQEEVSFSEFSFEVEGLETWLSVSGIEGEFSVDEDTGVATGIIRYRKPNDVVVRLPNGDILEFRFIIHSPSSSIPVTDVTIKQTASVYIRTPESRPISYFASLAHRLCNFLSLTLDQNVCIESMTGYLTYDFDPCESRRMPIRLYGDFAPWTDRKPDIRWYRTLFRYQEVASEIEDVLKKWFESYDKFSPALDLYFASKTQSTVFVEAKILWLAQALETLHSQSYSETELAEAEFDDRMLQLEQSNFG